MVGQTPKDEKPEDRYSRFFWKPEDIVLIKKGPEPKWLSSGVKEIILQSIFKGNKEAVDDYEKFYNDAIRRGSGIPTVVAIIKVRDIWVEEEAGWRKGKEDDRPRVYDKNDRIPKEPLRLLTEEEKKIALNSIFKGNREVTDDFERFYNEESIKREFIPFEIALNRVMEIWVEDKTGWNRVAKNLNCIKR